LPVPAPTEENFTDPAWWRGGDCFLRRGDVILAVCRDKPFLSLLWVGEVSDDGVETIDLFQIMAATAMRAAASDD